GHAWCIATRSERLVEMKPKRVGWFFLGVALAASRPASAQTISIVDPVGFFSSIARGADGHPLIAYYDSLSWTLKAAHCNNVACTTAATTTLDSIGFVAVQTISIKIGSDDLGLISYYDGTTGHLKVAHCNNTNCTSATITTLDSIGNVGLE